ncbi:MAG: 30S ribosomal protein S1 [Chlamydiae bacterium]|nr:30S ribosomal protein S1 [Chlamydiota bacterium]
MNQQQTFSWEVSKILDDEDFDKKDLQIFKELLGVSASKKQTEFAPGNLLHGTIVEITKDFVVVDVGLKSEGLIPTSEFTNLSELELGTEIEVLLENSEDREGQIVLSRQKAYHQRQWEYLVNNFKEGSIIRGTVVRKVKGGLIIDIGIDAFLPGSQVDNKRIVNLDDFIGKEYDFKILKINLERKNIVVSRREILEEERLSKKQEILAQIQEGDIVKGVVKNITDFGVFLDLDGIDGLLHITDMTWKRIRHPSEIVKLGDELEVMVLSIDHEKGRLALGLKQKEQNPWELIEEKYPPGTLVKGKIVNMLPYGAFIEIEPGIEGLIHVSEMSWTKNITDPTEVVRKGDEVEAIVLSIQKNEGKVSLGIKQTGKNPWENVEENYPVDKVVEVEIRSLTNYGAFVALEPGIDGLIHISDLSWTKKVSHPSEVFNVGDQIKAVVLSVDKESKKITLGIKQLSENPWETIEKEMPKDTVVKGVVTKVTAFGAFIELENSGLEALVHVTELSDKPFAKVEDVVSIGSTIEAKVLKVDPEHKKIALSMKEHSIDQTNVNRDEIVLGEKEEEEEEK